MGRSTIREMASGFGQRMLFVPLLAWMMVAVAASHPTAAAAQDAPASCAARPEDDDTFLAEVYRARDLGSEDAVDDALAALEPEARRRAAESPDDVAAQYHLAAVMGARLDIEHGSSKISGAEALQVQAARVLELAPEHPGASYMMGKLHASVLRLSGLKRFIAMRVLGGSALKSASWEEAQALLEVAVRGEPCVAEHHFELARVYAQQDDLAAAEREMGYVRELTAGQNGREARLRERAEEMRKEWRLPAR